MSTPYDRPARPWDLFNKNLGRVEDKLSKERLDICKGCEHLIPVTHQCKECGCFMNAKTKLPNAVCPIGKWQAVRISYKEEQEETK
jgi:ribosomal protein L32